MPAAWTAADQATLAAAAPELPPHDIRRHSEFWTIACGGGADGLRASLLVVARAVNVGGALRDAAHGGDYHTISAMVPIYDMYNHRNSDPRSAARSKAWHNTFTSATKLGEAFVVGADRDITAGEQLYNSYGIYTPEIFRDYGFVEQLPQRWYIDDDGDDTGSARGEAVRLDWYVVDTPAAAEGGGETAGGAATSNVRTVVWAPGARIWEPARAQKYFAVLTRKLDSLSPLPSKAEQQTHTPHQRLAWSYRTAFESAMRLALAAAVKYAGQADRDAAGREEL